MLLAPSAVSHLTLLGLLPASDTYYPAGYQAAC
ncbi:uncharacterized protein METZ01_LOCUS312188 [marine metagenome]|uniref:Uncharacterized protein n=1 Tax=marine metagenome TaxID=408172 RepID=A0A382NDQ4_9ZZZZ